MTDVNPVTDTTVMGSSRPALCSRLFMGNLPKLKSETDIAEELGRITSGLVRVITYKNSENPTVHRGFCFLDYDSVAAAARAKARLANRAVFGCKTIVDWADPEPEADEELMAAVRILFVRQYGNAPLDEQALATMFARYGPVERVKNLKNYSFVHFERREDALAAIGTLDGWTDSGGSGVRLEVSWAKPPADKRSRERMLRDRERRMRLICAAAPARPDAVVAPPPPSYSWYDHYVYDFGRVTGPVEGCACQRFDKDGPWKCSRRCPCAAAASAFTEGDHRDHGERERMWRWPYADDRRDCGDRADESDGLASVDDNVLKFFYKVSANAAPSTE